MMTALLSVGAWAADDVTLSTDFIVCDWNGGGGSYNSGSKTLWVAKWASNGWEFYTSRPISTTEFSGVTIDYESAYRVVLVITYEGGTKQESEWLTTTEATVKYIPFQHEGIVREVKFKSFNYDDNDKDGGNIVFNSVTLNGISGVMEAYPTSNLALPMNKMKDAGWGATYDEENQKVIVQKNSWSGWMINLPISATYYKSIHFELTSVASINGSIKLTFEDDTAYWIDTNDYQGGGSLDYPLTKGLKQIAFSGDNSDNTDGSTQTYGLGTCYIEPKPITATVSSLKWATYGVNAPIDYSATSGLTAYIAKVEDNKVKLTEVNKVPANTAVILYADVNTNTEYTLTPTAEVTDNVTANQLRVSDGTVTGNGTIYVLANGSNGVGFYRVTNGSAITAGKAYLDVSSGTAPQFIGFGDNTTGINEELRVKSEEGSARRPEGESQFATAQYYDLQGRHVAQPVKGLYIVNGKKVIIK